MLFTSRRVILFVNVKFKGRINVAYHTTYLKQDYIPLVYR